MSRFFKIAVWTLVSLLGAMAYAVVASRRGEPLSAAWMVVAALCTYAVGFRFYSQWIAAKVLMLDDRRATPAEVHDDGRDFVRTNKYVLFGHHFASISGPGPLVGPVLAAQVRGDRSAGRAGGRLARDGPAGHGNDITDAVATSSLNSDIDTLPDTA